ncbi:hypothetical protein [Meiothermus sp. CFH 77666]|uniref:DprA-like winged helix domain-containing protein n=1 Tax=Meiothermus sp. CFH 77666 TaxID=2817942 RepID=UPI00325FDF68
MERVLQRGPATVEAIAAELQITTPEALAALGQLELEGKVEQAGGRYRLVASKRGKSSSGKPIKSREICRVVWFDEAGRFAKAPRALEPVEPVKPKIWRKTTESLKLDDGGRASIQRVNWEPVKVTYFPPKEMLAEVKAARALKAFPVSRARQDRRALRVHQGPRVHKVCKALLAPKGHKVNPGHLVLRALQARRACRGLRVIKAHKVSRARLARWARFLFPGRPGSLMSWCHMLWLQPLRQL